jgi:hypothetical protein
MCIRGLSPRMHITANKGVSMQDLINRLKSAQELTRQLLVRL